MDTFDPKARLDRDHGKPIPLQVPATQFKTSTSVMRSPFRFANHGQSGAPVSEIFPHLATCVDEMTIIRSMVSEHSEHTAANYFLNTGAPTPGRPSMGAWTTYGLGAPSANLPSYVVLDSGHMPLGGQDCFSNGFLPARHQGTLFRRGSQPVENIVRREPTAELQAAKLSLLKGLNRQTREEIGGAQEVEAAIANYELAFEMQSAIPELTDLAGESKATRSLYGMDDPATEVFGTQCLMARRMLERGVQFVQLLPPKLTGITSWDQHNDLENHHRANALAVDRPIAGLLRDLSSRGMLDETLVLWGGEFGRTPMAQITANEAFGRDHNPYGFTMWLAGGGIRKGFTYGATDDFGYYAIENPVSIHDLHATMLHLLGMDHTALTFRHGGRDMRLTDVYGNVIHEILA